MRMINQAGLDLIKEFEGLTIIPKNNNLPISLSTDGGRHDWRKIRVLGCSCRGWKEI